MSGKKRSAAVFLAALLFAAALSTATWEKAEACVRVWTPSGWVCK